MGGPRKRGYEATSVAAEGDYVRPNFLLPYAHPDTRYGVKTNPPSNPGALMYLLRSGGQLKRQLKNWFQAGN
jgi:hypothetical protein